MSSQSRDPSPPPDEFLRRLLDPPPGTVRRLVTNALDDGAHGGRTPRRPWAPGPAFSRQVMAGAGLLAALLLTVGLWWAASRPAPLAPEAGPGYQVENSGTVVTIVGPTGQVQALISGDR